MRPEQLKLLTLYILEVVLFCLLVFILVRLIQKRNIQRRYNIVLKNSRKIPRVLELNDHFSLYPLASEYTFLKLCDSKAQFERCSFDDCLLGIVKENLLLLKELVDKAAKNREIMQSYEDEYDRLFKTDTEEDIVLYDKYKFFKEIEEELCQQRKLSPVSDLSVVIEIYYSSPQGRNNYSSKYHYYTDDILDCFGKIDSEIEYQESVKYQRELISAKLRYNVLKRDGFKFTICGRTQEDGVKLHVDHIFPVSKGGKTEMSNLRTLCDECNLGKGAEYDPYGLN